MAGDCQHHLSRVMHLVVMFQGITEHQRQSIGVAPGTSASPPARPTGSSSDRCASAQNSPTLTRSPPEADARERLRHEP